MLPGAGSLPRAGSLRRAGTLPRTGSLRRVGSLRLVPMALVAGVLLIAGCGDGRPDGANPGDGPAPTRREVVTTVVDEVVVPAYGAAASTAADLDEAVGSFCAAPSAATLDEARDALVAAVSAWERTAVFRLGPAMMRRSNSVVAYPSDGDKIDAAVAAGAPTDAASIRNRTGSALRGYGAVGHLLDGARRDPAVTEPAQCAYLTGLTGVVAEETATVAAAWTDGSDGEEPYRDTAMAPATGLVDDLVNEQLGRFEAESKALSAAPEARAAAGDAGGAGLAGDGLLRLRSQLDGAAAVNAELSSLLPPRVADQLDEETAVLKRALAGADRPAVDPSSGPSPAAVRDAVEGLRATLRTEVVSALDVTVGFSDNDGDS